jgi:hypothetical protein
MEGKNMPELILIDNPLQSDVSFDRQAPQPGRHAGVPETDYFAAAAVNASTLKHMGRSALHCKAEMTRSDDRPDTEAQKVGRLIHCAVLEPERFAAEYVREPTTEDYPDALVTQDDYKAQAKELSLKVGGSKEQLKKRISDHLNEKAAAFLARNNDDDPKVVEWARLNYCALALPDGLFFDSIVAAETEGKTALKADHWHLAQAIIESIGANDRARKILSDGTPEETLIWQDELTGLLCKSRMDYYREDLGVVVDVKTTEDARPGAVSRDIRKYGYHISAAHYLDGLRTQGLNGGESFVWVFVEKKPPYAIALYVASAAMLAKGEQLRHQYLTQFARSKLSGLWPGYAGEFQTIDLPTYA